MRSTVFCYIVCFPLKLKIIMQTANQGTNEPAFSRGKNTLGYHSIDKRLSQQNKCGVNLSKSVGK